MNATTQSRRDVQVRRRNMQRRASWFPGAKGAALWLLLPALFLAVPRLRAQDSAPNEYQIKAAFLFNFTQFVDWPASSFATPESPFLVCVIGKDPFGHFLDEYLLRKKIGEHPVQIARFPNLQETTQFRTCHIVFLSASLGHRVRDAIESFRGANALLVGDTPDFAASGGAIELTLDERHVHFTINPDAADRAGLRVSSKLLSLAKIVHDESGNGQS